MFEIVKRLQRIFSKVYFRLSLEFAPKKIFVTSRKALTNFFEGVFSTLIEFVPKKIFVISQTSSINFFEECTHDYFQIIHLEKGLK